MVPSTRQEFADFCLRKLGAPVINVEVAPEQVDDRIDEALSFFRDYHYDGSELTYYKYTVTDADIANHYVILPDPLMFSITRLWPIGNMALYPTDMFSLNYQIALNDLWNLTSVSMVPYYLAMEQLNLIQELLVGRQPTRFNQLDGKIYVDMSWDRVKDGDFIIFEGYNKIDDSTNGLIWGERMLQNYCTALIRVQWWSNLSKFQDGQLTSGMKFNAETQLQRALKEEADIRQDIRVNYSYPVYDQYF